ncbi:MAG: bifunctional phosphoglucose/phosphomannose isomerase [Cytophagales bacterium]|nr:MAG: bifunctional phosphoglucose/phosphomannose isomerase [Cytophagales bacterium]
MMYELIEQFPLQLKKAIDIGKNYQALPLKNTIENIVIAGMGGSGIGGNLVQQWVYNHAKIPIFSAKTYTLPAFVGAKTLFIASSFSGSTEETLEALQIAENKGAQIAIISSGGTAIERAQAKKYPHIQIPQEAPSPRAFIGYSFVQIMYLLYHQGFIGNYFEQPLQEATQLIANKQVQIKAKAEEIAQFLYQKEPIIYSATEQEAVVLRLQQQINENAKQLCHYNTLPEMNHNELVGWGLAEQNYQHKAIITVRSQFEVPRVTKRFEISKPIWETKNPNCLEINPIGNTLIEEHIYLIHLFDWTSYYLALLNQVDPFPVEVINHLKNELAKVI